MWLNWGRSAVELRDADAASVYGGAWEDRHLPIGDADPEAGSLLNDAHVAQ